MPAGDLAMLPNRRRRRLLRTLFAFLGGLAAGFLFFAGPCSPHGGGAQWTLQEAPLHPVAQEEDPLKIVGLNPNDRVSLLFVGVMTARKYLSTRAVAVYDTWGSGIPGKIAFFSSEDSYRPEGRPDLPLVALRGVDDSYPPQKKSFLMLQYMWENYGRKFEWFLRADDDVYVRPDRLEAFLRSVDSKKAQFIGQAGRGNQEEFGLLSLEYDENFCMGGPGVIMNRETLSRVAPHLRQCLKNLYTTHEDVELGRCVQKYAGIPCTWSYEMQTILYHNSSGKDAFTGSLKQKEVHRAITLHPVKQYKHLYRIHNYMQMLKVQELQQDSLNLHRDILAMAKLLRLQLSNIKPEVSPFNKDYLGDSVLLGQLPGLKKYNPKSINEIQSWEFIQRALYSTSESNPKRRLESPLREGLDDVIREVMELINMYSKQRGRVIDFKEILYGYYQYNALYGADYILDMLLVYKKYRGRKMTVPVRRHAYLQQQFTGIEIREIREGKVGDVLSSDDQADYLTENNSGGLRETLENGVIKIGQSLPIVLSQGTTSGLEEFQRIERKVINFILPLAGRFESFRRFITVFENVCLKKKERVTLTVVMFLNDEDKSVHSSMELVKDLQARYHYTRIAIIPVFDNFARAKALQVGASHVHAPDDLLFFIDVDVIFRSPALYRIRTQTIRGKQVYFPIVFSEFDPQVVYNMSVSPNHFLISNDAGFWRQYGFGIASVYKSDLIKVGGFNTSIRGWGKEDVDLFDKFISTAQNLTVFRSVDRDLIHVFHVVECDSQLEESQLRMCKGTRADTYGSVQQLAEVIRHSRLKPRPDNYVHKQTNS